MKSKQKDIHVRMFPDKIMKIHKKHIVLVYINSRVELLFSQFT